ncbi:hypothetical protein HanIR_Chr11g0559661 [Helianthus annuus]|nr:hypothetical protein HanIR_Chr11g0559661 [Helianthus annuus]
MFICNCLNISRNLPCCLSFFCFFNLLGYGTGGLYSTTGSWSCAVLVGTRLAFTSYEASVWTISVIGGESDLSGPVVLPLLVITALTCPLGFGSVLPGRPPWGLSDNILANLILNGLY